MKKPGRILATPRAWPSLAAITLILSATASTWAATDTWTGSSGLNWSAPANWTGGNAPPQSGDALIFNTTPGSSTLNNDLSGLAVDSITFTGSGFTLNGHALLISGNTNGTNIGILNNSGGSPETIGLNLNVDWGYYTFTGNYSSPNGLALSGTLTLNSGGIAFFDPYVTSTSLTTDGTGLITGLDGAGLMYSGTAPTGLAMISGGSIQPYSAFTQVASGTISSGNNLELTATSSTAYTSSGVTVNTITVDQPGSGNSLSTTTLNNTGTLTVGNLGGIYVLDSVANARGVFVLSGGNLTAGTVGTPATLILAANGGSTTNQSQIGAVVQDNGTGGAVTVVTTGNGVVNLSKADTYSGGTYVTQGELLGTGAVSALGTGPVYIAGGATVVLNVGGTWANNFYFSPGLGDVSTGQILNSGSLVWDNTLTLSGTINLMGPPATTGHGDRISGNDTGGSLTITGQITGTGTLEIGGAHSVGAITLDNTSTANPNNWQGGLILNANTGVAVNTYFKMGANNQIPSGANAGNVTLLPATSAVYARFDLNGFNAVINGLISTITGAGSAFAQIGDFGSANSTLTLGGNNATASFTGVSTDGGNGKALSIVKIGTGIQTFSGTLSHYGNTTVSNGTFDLQAAMPNSSNVIVAPAGILDASQGPNGGLTVGASQTLTGTGMVIGNTTVNGVLAAGLMAVSGVNTNIGVLTNAGNMTLDGGSTNAWYVNNAGGTAGGTSGWSILNVTNNGQLSINNASVTSPIRIKIVSLNALGSPGNATFNPNISQSWTLIQTANPISGYTGTAQFVVDTSAFSNLPSGSSQFSVTTNAGGNNLVLNYSSTPVITSALVNETNNAGSTAVFTVTAAGATPITFQWVQQGTIILANNGNSASGATVTIITNGGGTTSTLTLTGVQDADDGDISVFVTNNSGEFGSSTATLFVIDVPSNPNITQSGATDPVTGGVTYLTETPGSGTPPYSYVWKFDGTVISGATNSVLPVQISPGSVGSYTVVVSNQAGTVANTPFVISGPISVVPDQLIYEPFDSYGQMGGPSAPYTWQGVTNLFDQATGEPAYWFHSSGSRISMVISPNDFPSFTVNSAPGYPWPGLAGNSANCMYQEVSSSDSDNDQLQFYTNSFAPGQSVYFSFVFNAGDPFGSVNVGDCVAAFNVTDQGGAGTSFNLKISTQIQTDGSYWLGLSKGDGNTGASQGVDANTMWQTGFQPGQDVFVVGLYQINSGLSANTDDTVSAWFNPPGSSYGSATAPTPTFGPSTFGVLNSSSIHTFVVHGVQYPNYRYYSDIRIGTTWASVTPTSAPELTLYNEPLTHTVVFPSQNAGNPVTGNYQWYVNGNTTALTDGANTNHDGSIISGSSTATLTITGATAADLGTYTVSGSNTDPAPADSGGTLTGSASALLTALPPRLSIANSTTNITLSWPTNWDVVLEETTNLAPPTTWTDLTGATVSGTNDTITVNAGTNADLYFRLAPQ